MTALPIWRVRVKRSVEEWVEVQAATAQEAETKAYHLPQVLSVFGRSAIPGNLVAVQSPLAGVQEELF